MALAGRTIQVVSDMSLDEQLYLFQRARLLKQASGGAKADTGPALCEIADKDAPLKLDDHDATVYLIFMDGSTRTRESIRNAGVYHGVKVNEFQVETSSFQKSETITDTMKMLSVYSIQRSVFVIRSQLEGVCRCLQASMPTHSEKFGIPTPSFLNAGDGRFSHPVGELSDMFSLLEQANWDRSSMHIVLVGDLAHGRTAHSKVDGLTVFEKVRVDLVAPPMFEYPVEYRNRMRSQGFWVREFDSLEEYFHKAEGDLATVWYFFQPQLKRCGDLDSGSIAELVRKVSFLSEWQAKLPKDAAFFQTLPRNKTDPLVPLSFDDAPLNCWDHHASNAYYLHVVLLAMLFGTIGQGIPDTGASSKPKGLAKRPLPSSGSVTSMMSSVYPFAGQVVPANLPAFLTPVDISSEERLRRPERARPGGAVPLRDGLVVDHIGLSVDPSECWQRLRMVRTILEWGKHIGCEGVYESTSQKDKHLHKAIISLPNFAFEKITVPQMKMLASVAPGCTINAIKSSKVTHKFRVSVPERIYDLPNIQCNNRACVSHPLNKQRDVAAYFERAPFYETSVLPGCEVTDYLFVCKYCKWPHRFEMIWGI